MLISAAAMQAHERAIIAGGVSAAHLMDSAADGIAQCMTQFFPQPGTVVCYGGKGNNAGDALAVAVRLRAAGWRVMVRLAQDAAQMAELPQQHWQTLSDHARVCADAGEVLRAHPGGPLLLLDGLIGLGSSGALRGPLRELAREMNVLRCRHHAQVCAIDLPSGLHADSGVPCEDAVIADFTTTIALVKQGLVKDEALRHVGRLVVIPVPELERSAPGVDAAQLLTPKTLLPLLPRREMDWHKGTAGRLAIVAGSAQCPGAAILCAMGAVRGGAGLVTLYCQPELHATLAAKLPAEVMLRRVSALEEVLDQAADGIAIGPGLGDQVDAEIIEVIRRAPCPVVVDADALNTLARTGLDPLNHPAGPRLLTPHPGEMSRLDQRSQLPRRERAESFAAAYPALTLLLKGSRTVIASCGRPTRFNSTGHPGMACGGMGDVLTGLLAALVCQKVDVADAAALGSWLLGRAAELALQQRTVSAESLAASDVAGHLGAAFQALRESPF
jgi:ADP-dependent NAD(P)H-hydrate dehydratase / NAD(P)H-hydrate epimerase